MPPPPDKTDGLKTKGSISSILKCIIGDINLIRMEANGLLFLIFVFSGVKRDHRGFRATTAAVSWVLMSLLCLFYEANNASRSRPFVRRLAPVLDGFNRLWSPASARNGSRLHIISPRTRYGCCHSNHNYKRFINSQVFHQFGCQTKRIYIQRK